MMDAYFAAILSLLRIDPRELLHQRRGARSMISWREEFVVAYPVSPYIEERDGGLYVAGARVSIDSVVIRFQEGASPERIVQSFPALKLRRYTAPSGNMSSRIDPRNLRTACASCNWERAK
jgi:hypothetical protein